MQYGVKQNPCHEEIFVLLSEGVSWALRDNMSSFWRIKTMSRNPEIVVEHRRSQREKATAVLADVSLCYLT